MNDSKKNVATGDLISAENQLSQTKSLILQFPENHIIWSYYYLNKATLYNNKGNFNSSFEYCEKAQNSVPIRGYNDIRANIE